MTWQDRLREGAYTPPSGTRLTFQFEDVRELVNKQTTAHNFPDAKGTFIQDFGSSDRRYPMRLFFNGDDHDIEAATFLDALLETGIGKLEHPMYGTKNVIPVDTIARRDNLKTAANQSVIELSFWETIDLIYPSSQTNPASEVRASVDEFNVAAANEFAGSTELDSVVEKATAKSLYQKRLDSAKDRLERIAKQQEDVLDQFNAIVDSINEGIDTLIADPLTLAFQTSIALQAPARALTSIAARLDAYSDLAGSIILGDDAVVTFGSFEQKVNAFHIDDLYASSYVTGALVSVINHRFETKNEAIAAAQFVLDLFERVAAWRDDNFAELQEIDTGETYQQLQEATAVTAGFLVEISFNLKQERSLVLDRARTIIDLVAELSGSIDPELDFFISSNEFTGSEILELSVGREVVYYV